MSDPAILTYPVDCFNISLFGSCALSLMHNILQPHIQESFVKCNKIKNLWFVNSLELDLTGKSTKEGIPMFLLTKLIIKF